MITRVGNTNKLILSEQDYINSMFGLIDEKNLKNNRTGTDTYANYGYQFNFNIGDPTKQLPILMGKHTQLKGALVEIVWILMGRTDNKFLEDNGVKYWKPWQDSNGEFGPIYGEQMRNFNGVDQLKELIYGLKNNFESRRHIASLWNPTDLTKMALPPCHFNYHFTTFKVQSEKYFNLHVLQRSGDSFIGIPYDLLMFMFFMEIVGFVTDIKSNELFLTVNDYHLYENHLKPLSEYDRNYSNIRTTNKKYPTQIKFKDFVYDMKKENPDISMDEFLHYIALNDFDVFEFKDNTNSEFNLGPESIKIRAAVAV